MQASGLQVTQVVSRDEEAMRHWKDMGNQKRHNQTTPIIEVIADTVLEYVIR